MMHNARFLCVDSPGTSGATASRCCGIFRRGEILPVDGYVPAGTLVPPRYTMQELFWCKAFGGNSVSLLRDHPCGLYSLQDVVLLTGVQHGRHGGVTPHTDSVKKQFKKQKGKGKKRKNNSTPIVQKIQLIICLIYF